MAGLVRRKVSRERQNQGKLTSRIGKPPTGARMTVCRRRHFGLPLVASLSRERGSLGVRRATGFGRCRVRSRTALGRFASKAAS